MFCRKKNNRIETQSTISLKNQMTTEELTIEVNKALEKSDLLNSDGGDITLISIEMISMLKCASGSLYKLQCEQMTLKQV
jgi:hypothetical protein